MREVKKAYWEGVGSFPSMSLAFLYLAGFTIFLDSFEAAILKVSLLVFHMVTDTVGFAGPAVLILGSGLG